MVTGSKRLGQGATFLGLGASSSQAHLPTHRHDFKGTAGFPTPSPQFREAPSSLVCLFGDFVISCDERAKKLRFAFSLLRFDY